MAKYLYTSDFRQGVNQIVQNAYKKTLDHQLNTKTNLNTFFSRISNDLKWFATEHNLEFYSIAFTDDTAVLELKASYGSLVTTVLCRNYKVYVTIYSTLDDRLVELLRIVDNCSLEPKFKEVEVHILKEDNEKLVKENARLKEKLELLSGKSLKESLLKILNDIEEVESKEETK